ncbi:MAG: hypothetical protein AABZ47_06615, partial [Planctomycetota bacterium]
MRKDNRNSTPTFELYLWQRWVISFLSSSACYIPHFTEFMTGDSFPLKYARVRRNRWHRSVEIADTDSRAHSVCRVGIAAGRRLLEHFSFFCSMFADNRSAR